MRRRPAGGAFALERHQQRGSAICPHSTLSGVKSRTPLRLPSITVLDSIMVSRHFDKPALRGPDLDPTVQPVGHKHVAILFQTDARGSVQLAGAIAEAAEPA